jgi:HEAT repeat protein
MLGIMPSLPVVPRKGNKASSDPLVERLLDDEDLNDHFAAREELAALPAARRAAVTEAVIAATTGKNPRTAGIGVLADLGDEGSVAALVTLASHRDEEVREEAVMALGNLESHPAAAVPALVEALADKSEDVRDQAADALADYASPAAVEPLLAALALAHQKARWQKDVQIGSILAALAASGPGEARVVDALVEHLVPGEKVVSGPAFTALVELGGKAAGASAALEKLTAGADADVWMAIHAHRTLIALGAEPAAHVPPIIEALLVKEPGGAVSSAASALLEDLGAKALPFLETAVKTSKNVALRKAAERVRGKMTARR